MKIVRTGLEQKQLQVSDSRLGYVPHTFAILSESEMALASKMLDALSELPEVNTIYDNIQLDSSTS